MEAMSPVAQGVTDLVGIAGFAAAILFILGLKSMSSPVTARSGILVAGVGMLVAVLAAFGGIAEIPPAQLPRFETNIALALLALALGTGWAWWSGKRVAITAMPQMVALYNGMGGGAAAAIAAVALIEGQSPTRLILASTVIGALIGAVSLAGSVIAWAKLDGRVDGNWRFQGQPVLQWRDLPGDLGARAGGDSSARHNGGACAWGVVLHRCLGLWRPHDTADRRRRHAGRDLFVQRLHRPCCGP